MEHRLFKKRDSINNILKEFSNINVCGHLSVILGTEICIYVTEERKQTGQTTV
jgi:hypothetical protein